MSKQLAVREVELTVPLGLTTVEEIVWAERVGDAAGWFAAERIASLLDQGMSQRALAGKIGKTHTHVGQMARTWQHFGNLGFHERPAFNDARHSPEVRGPAAEKPKLIEPETPPQIEQKPGEVPAPERPIIKMKPGDDGAWERPEPTPEPPEPKQIPQPEPEEPEEAIPLPPAPAPPSDAKAAVAFERYLTETRAFVTTLSGFNWPPNERKRLASVFRQAADQLEAKE